MDDFDYSDELEEQLIKDFKNWVEHNRPEERFYSEDE